MFSVRAVVQCSLIKYQRNKETIETIMPLHLSRVDDVMLCIQTPRSEANLVSHFVDEMTRDRSPRV